MAHKEINVSEDDNKLLMCVQRILALESVAVYGPIVDQLVATGLPMPSWAGFNPALVPNRAPYF